MDKFLDVMLLHPKQEIQKYRLQSFSIHDPKRWGLQILQLFIRSHVIGHPLLELRCGHVVVFQVKIPETSLVRQLIYDAAESFTVWFSATKSRILLIAHASLQTHHAPVW